MNHYLDIREIDYNNITKEQMNRLFTREERAILDVFTNSNREQDPSLPFTHIPSAEALAHIYKERNNSTIEGVARAGNSENDENTITLEKSMKQNRSNKKATSDETQKKIESETSIEDKQCVICLEGKNVSENYGLLNVCNHIFHWK